MLFLSPGWAGDRLDVTKTIAIALLTMVAAFLIFLAMLIMMSLTT